MLELTRTEMYFLEAVKQWMNEPGTTVYLAGGDANVDCTRTSGHSVHKMSESLKNALVSAGVIDESKIVEQKSHRHWPAYYPQTESANDETYPNRSPSDTDATRQAPNR